MTPNPTAPRAAPPRERTDAPAAYAASLQDIRDAAQRIAPHVHRTPVFTSRTLDELAGRQLFFKCEPFQRGGSFKFRGALNAVLSLSDDDARRGVVTHSSGNYAQALTMAARIRGVPAWVVMPENAPRVKVAAVREYGGTVVPCPLMKRQEYADRVRAETGATFLPSYDHPDVIAGQATCGMELFEQAPDLDAVVVPIGGGGLLSGVTLAFHYLSPTTRAFAAEPLGADDAARSKAAGRIIPQTGPQTIADGLRTSLGQHTWPVVRDLVEEVVTVREDEIVAAMRLLFERLKVVVEPSGAVGLAVALSEHFRGLDGVERVGIVLSGGNVDLDALPF